MEQWCISKSSWSPYYTKQWYISKFSWPPNWTKQWYFAISPTLHDLTRRKRVSNFASPPEKITPGFHWIGYWGVWVVSRISLDSLECRNLFGPATDLMMIHSSSRWPSHCPTAGSFCWTVYTHFENIIISRFPITQSLCHNISQFSCSLDLNFAVFVLVILHPLNLKMFIYNTDYIKLLYSSHKFKDFPIFRFFLRSP
jgi:hypothetical protein